MPERAVVPILNLGQLRRGLPIEILACGVGSLDRDLADRLDHQFVGDDHDRVRGLVHALAECLGQFRDDGDGGITVDGSGATAADSVVTIEVSVLDYEGNQSAFSFYLKGTAALAEVPKPEQIRWNADNVLENGAVHVFIPSGALYHDAVFDLVQLANENYIIGEGNALQKHMTITWDLDSVQRTKVGWFLWEVGRKGSKDAITGTREGDQLVFETRSTGKYYLDQDLKKPTISIVSSTASARPDSNFRQFHVCAAHAKTGIDRYSARIDGEFARIDFDYKQDLLKVIVPKDITAGNHNLRVVVIDGVGNTTVEEYDITL